MNTKKIALVTVSTIVNVAVTGCNQVVLARMFGSGTSMDAFLACGAVPFVILNLAIGDLSYILVPLLTKYAAPNDQKLPINTSFSAICWLAAGMTVIGLAAHRQILMFTTYGLSTATFNVADTLAPYMWMIIGLTIIGSYLTGLHHHYRSFVLPAATLALPYLSMIAGALLMGTHIGILAVVLGWVCGTLVRVVLLYRTLGQNAPSFTIHVRHPATNLLFRRLTPLGLSLLPYAALPCIDVFWASRLPTGSISFLGYGSRVVIALTSLVVQGLSVVLFPELSADAARGHYKGLARKINDASTSILGTFVPLAVIVFLVRVPMLSTILQHGHFTSESTAGVSTVLPFFLCGAVWMSMMNIISRSFYALEDYYTPAKSGIAALIAYFVLTGLLVRLWSYQGISIAYAAFWFLLFFVQSRELNTRLGCAFDLRFWSFALRVIVSSVVGCCAALYVKNVIGGSSATISVVEILVFLAVFYGLATHVFRIDVYRITTLRIASQVGVFVGATG